MTFDVNVALPAAGDIPALWLSAALPHIGTDENAFVCLKVDLDERLHFVPTLLLATNRRLLSLSQDGATVREWPYRAGLALAHHDHAGVGHLELLDAHGLLHRWRFTLGQNLQALRLVDQFMAQQNIAVSGLPVAPLLQAVCPSCKAPLEPDQEECPVCTKVVHTPPSTWTLLRLWRFARPYRG
ncbi:MAG: ABC transporter, partial [Rhodoferax sp.]|nr:ABC transporter [Rhodoferax sp.]